MVTRTTTLQDDESRRRHADDDQRSDSLPVIAMSTTTTTTSRDATLTSSKGREMGLSILQIYEALVCYKLVPAACANPAASAKMPASTTTTTKSRAMGTRRGRRAASGRAALSAPQGAEEKGNSAGSLSPLFVVWGMGEGKSGIWRRRPSLLRRSSPAEADTDPEGRHMDSTTSAISFDSSTSSFPPKSSSSSSSNSVRQIPPPSLQNSPVPSSSSTSSSTISYNRNLTTSLSNSHNTLTIPPYPHSQTSSSSSSLTKKRSDILSALPTLLPSAADKSRRGGRRGDGGGGTRWPYAGLKNLGATCYMNSCLQAYFMNEHFRAALMRAATHRSISPQEGDNPAAITETSTTGSSSSSLTSVASLIRETFAAVAGTLPPKEAAAARAANSSSTCSSRSTSLALVSELQKLFAFMSCDEVAAADPRGIATALNIHTATQEDATEFATLLLSSLERELSAADNNIIQHQQLSSSWSPSNFIPRLFRGRQTHFVQCASCGSRSASQDCFYELRLQLSSSSSLTAPSAATERMPRPSAAGSSRSQRRCAARSRAQPQHSFSSVEDSMMSDMLSPQTAAPTKDSPKLKEEMTKAVRGAVPVVQFASSDEPNGHRDELMPKAQRGGVKSESAEQTSTLSGSSLSQRSSANRTRHPRRAKPHQSSSSAKGRGTAKTGPLEEGEVVMYLEDGLDSLYQTELLEGANQYTCAKCDRKTDAERWLSLDHAPPYLNICLERYAYNWTSGMRRKLSMVVDFPAYLDLSKYYTPQGRGTSAQSFANVSASDEDEHRIRNAVGDEADDYEGDYDDSVGIYELVGILEHKGSSALSGHYTACLRDSNYMPRLTATTAKDRHPERPETEVGDQRQVANDGGPRGQHEDIDVVDNSTSGRSDANGGDGCDNLQALDSDGRLNNIDAQHARGGSDANTNGVDGVKFEEGDQGGAIDRSSQPFQFPLNSSSIAMATTAASGSAGEVEAEIPRSEAFGDDAKELCEGRGDDEVGNGCDDGRDDDDSDDDDALRLPDDEEGIAFVESFCCAREALRKFGCNGAARFPRRRGAAAGSSGRRYSLGGGKMGFGHQGKDEDDDYDAHGNRNPDDSSDGDVGYGGVDGDEDDDEFKLEAGDGKRLPLGSRVAAAAAQGGDMMMSGGSSPVDEKVKLKLQRNAAAQRRRRQRIAAAKAAARGAADEFRDGEVGGGAKRRNWTPPAGAAENERMVVGEGLRGKVGFTGRRRTPRGVKSGESVSSCLTSSVDIGDGNDVRLAEDDVKREPSEDAVKDRECEQPSESVRGDLVDGGDNDSKIGPSLRRVRRHRSRIGIKEIQGKHVEGDATTTRGAYVGNPESNGDDVHGVVVALQATDNGFGRRRLRRRGRVPPVAATAANGNDVKVDGDDDDDAEDNNRRVIGGAAVVLSEESLTGSRQRKRARQGDENVDSGLSHGIDEEEDHHQNGRHLTSRPRADHDEEHHQRERLSPPQACPSSPPLLNTAFRVPPSRFRLPPIHGTHQPTSAVMPMLSGANASFKNGADRLHEPERQGSLVGERSGGLAGEDAGRFCGREKEEDRKVSPFLDDIFNETTTTTTTRDSVAINTTEGKNTAAYCPGDCGSDYEGDSESKSNGVFCKIDLCHEDEQGLNKAATTRTTLLNGSGLQLPVGELTDRDDENDDDEDGDHSSSVRRKDKMSLTVDREMEDAVSANGSDDVCDDKPSVRSFWQSSGGLKGGRDSREKMDARLLSSGRADGFLAAASGDGDGDGAENNDKNDKIGGGDDDDDDDDGCRGGEGAAPSVSGDEDGRWPWVKFDDLRVTPWYPDVYFASRRNKRIRVFPRQKQSARRKEDIVGMTKDDDKARQPSSATTPRWSTMTTTAASGVNGLDSDACGAAVEEVPVEAARDRGLGECEAVRAVSGSEGGRRMLEIVGVPRMRRMTNYLLMYRRRGWRRQMMSCRHDRIQNCGKGTTPRTVPCGGSAGEDDGDVKEALSQLVGILRRREAATAESSLAAASFISRRKGVVRKLIRIAKAACGSNSDYSRKCDELLSAKASDLNRLCNIQHHAASSSIPAFDEAQKQISSSPAAAAKAAGGGYDEAESDGGHHPLGGAEVKAVFELLSKEWTFLPSHCWRTFVSGADGHQKVRAAAAFEGGDADGGGNQVPVPPTGEGISNAPFKLESARVESGVDGDVVMEGQGVDMENSGGGLGERKRRGSIDDAIEALRLLTAMGLGEILCAHAADCEVCRGLPCVCYSLERGGHRGGLSVSGVGEGSVVLVPRGVAVEVMIELFGAGGGRGAQRAAEALGVGRMVCWECCGGCLSASGGSQVDEALDDRGDVNTITLQQPVVGGN